MMKRKVCIIGSGHVGTHVASALALRGIADEIVLIDNEDGKAEGMSLDLEDGNAYYPHAVSFSAGSYNDIFDAQIIINSASGTISTKDRTLELARSLEVVRDIAPKIVSSGFKGIIISISNPCDVVAQYLQELTGLNVFGTGTALDSARVKIELSKILSVDSHSVQAYSFGEHGNSQFVPFSDATISGMPFRTYLEKENINFDESNFINKIREKAFKIFKAKPCTEFGIGNACAELVQAVFTDSKIVLPASYLMKGEYGISGVYLSVLRVIGKNGVEKTLEIPLSEDELEKLKKSAFVIGENLKNGKAAVEK